MRLDNKEIKAEMKKLYQYVKSRNIRGLRELSNVFTDDLLIYQDSIFLDLALCSLVLAKTIEKPRFWKFDDWKRIIFSIEDSLKECIERCDEHDKRGMEKVIKRILAALTSVDRKDKRYVDSIMTQGRTKVGASLYAHGLSLGKASYMSGASKNAILKYSGRTLISDRFGKTYSMMERIKNVREVFRD